MRQSSHYSTLALLIGVTFSIGVAVTDAQVGAADPDLVGWWKLDEGLGTEITDSSRYGNDSNQASTTLQWIDGRINGALEFNGTSDFVEFAQTETLDIRNAVTVTLWVRTNDVADGVHKALVMKGEFTYGMRFTDANDLEFRIFSTGYHTVKTPVTDAFNDVWHHLAGVYDGSVLALYIDGELKDSLTYSGVINKDTNYYVNLGQNSQGDSNNRWWYNGAMDDVRIYSRALSQEDIRKMLRPEYPSMPTPVDGAKDAWPDVVLGWTAGIAVATHDVYLGTVLDDVSNAGRDNPLGVLLSRNQDSVAYDPPGRLAFDQTYYWRIDEVSAAPDSTIYKGDVWSLRVPFGFPVESVIATASSSNKSTTGPENTVNRSGLDENDLHSTNATTMWLSAKGAESPAWIEYDLGRLYKLHEMQVWNYNVQVERVLGFGFKDVTIEYSMDATSWTALGDFQFNQGPSQAGYACNTTVDLANLATRYVRLTAPSNWSGRDQYGLSEVRFLAIPTYAQQPQPATGQTDVGRDITLEWRASREADVHEVYVSSDETAVADETVLIDAVTDSQYELAALDLGTTYYWKINEVNEAEDPSRWDGPIWNFTTTTYLIVDGFESYTDDEAADLAIWQTWLDGYNIPANGMQVGHGTQPYAEQTIVYAGDQSMPVTYDNTTTATSSIAERTFETPEDWTRAGVTTLTLHFYGVATNDANEPMWVRLTGQNGSDGTVTYGQAADEDIANQATAAWARWNIPLADFGVNLAQIQSIAIGFGQPGGASPRSAGTMYFDDIRIGKPTSGE